MISDEMVGLFGFDHDVINIGLNGPPNEVLSIQRWYVALVFFKPNDIVM